MAIIAPCNWIVVVVIPTFLHWLRNKFIQRNLYGLGRRFPPLSRLQLWVVAYRFRKSSIPCLPQEWGGDLLASKWWPSLPIFFIGLGSVPYHTIPRIRKVIFSPLHKSVSFPYFFIALRRVPSRSILMRWSCDIRPLSQIEVVVSPRVVVVISIYLHWFRTGSTQYHPKGWGGPPLKSISFLF